MANSKYFLILFYLQDLCTWYWINPSKEWYNSLVTWIMLFCMDQTIMILILSLTYVCTPAHLTSPTCLLHLWHWLWFSLGSDRTHQLPLYCLVGFVTYETSDLFGETAQRGMQALSSFPSHTPNTSHLYMCTGARTLMWVFVWGQCQI